MKFCSEAYFFGLEVFQRAWNLRPPALVPPGGIVIRIFTSWKNPSTLAGFEPANLESRGEHVTPRPPRSVLKGGNGKWRLCFYRSVVRCHCLFKPLLLKIFIKTRLHHILSCLVNIVNNIQDIITNERQAKGICKQDPEENIWDQEGCKWGVEKSSEWRTS